MKRGKILLDLYILERWDSELERMNKGKESEQYAYPEIFIKLLDCIRLLFHLPYRQMEGFLKGLRRFDSRILVPDYSTIGRGRIGWMPSWMRKITATMVLVVDGSGIKGSNRGEWIRRKWKVRRGILEYPHRCGREAKEDSRVGGDQ